MHVFKHAAANLSLLGILLIAIAGCGSRQSSKADANSASRTWRFAIEEAEGSVQHKYALKFKELIEDRTDGEIEVIIYPYGTLGTSTHLTEQLNLGVVQFAMASPGSLGKFIPQLQVFLLHFVLPQDSLQRKQQLSDPSLIDYLDRLYAPKGLKLLSVYSEGQMVWTLNKEVRNPKDFRGVKMRVMTSPILLSAYSAYGASPTPMPYSEVYSALQLNMIDGQVNPVFAIERQKFHEVTSWMVFPGHASFITTCAACRPFLNGLSPELQQTVATVITELDDYAFQIQNRFETERLKVIIEDKKRQKQVINLCGDLQMLRSSLTTDEQRDLIDENEYLNVTPPLSSDEIRQFREATLEVRDKYLQIGGPQSDDLLQRLLSAMDR